MKKKKGESDVPDYEKLRSEYNKKYEEKSWWRLYILMGIIFIGGIVAWVFFEDLRLILPKSIWLTPLVIGAFMLVWGFFLPDLIIQDLMGYMIEIPEAARLLCHVFYSYILAWLIIELWWQIESRESKKLLIITSLILVILLAMVTATLVIFKLL